MDAEDLRALAELRAPVAPLATRVRLPHMTTCPHCHEGFGRASFPIHVRRCRALLSTSNGDDTDTNGTGKPVKRAKRQEVRSLVDLCLRFVTKHFESICMDKIVAFPEAEAALIASMPSNLVHRMVINLVKESNRTKAKNHENRAAIFKLEQALQTSQREVAHMESVRNAEATVRMWLTETQQGAQRLERELDTCKAELAVSDAENRQLRTQVESYEKQRLRLEAKINALSAEKDSLKAAAKAAQKREMEATRQLALANKAPASNGTSARRNSSKAVAARASKSAADIAARADPNEQTPERIAATRELISTKWRDSYPCADGGEPDCMQRRRPSPVVRLRPRSAGSKIPFPPQAAVGGLRSQRPVAE